MATLARFERRGAGTDSERRAATWLVGEVETKSRAAAIEPFWCRPNWALAHAWHVALGVAGSLVTEAEAHVGGALILLALLSLIADAVTGVSLGRRLTREHASQNVVSESVSNANVHLIVTANYDAGRSGLVSRGRLRAAAAAAADTTNRWGPGWLGWLALALAWALTTAILRLEGHRGTVIGIAQLIPTVGLVAAFALLVEQASAAFGGTENDNSSGVAAAIALAKALDAAPPRHLNVDLVLQGAGDGGGIGLRRYLRRRGRERTAPNTVVLGIAPCAHGHPLWFQSDGALVPMSYFRALRQLCESLAREDPGLRAHPRRSRGQTPALAARERRLPAIALGATGNGSDAVDLVVEFGLLLVEAIDAYVATRTPARQPTPA
jgi:ABC-type proline/glycine betaine transport system permease subunit